MITTDGDRAANPTLCWIFRSLTIASLISRQHKQSQCVNGLSFDKSKHWDSQPRHYKRRFRTRHARPK